MPTDSVPIRSSKISKDPNNTKWTKNTNSFGQKIMRSQGWAPGQYLGAQDAPHSELHTAANASYIRVTLKDDMKGLGFKKAKEDEITGLDVFSDLLSRLNGKSEEAIEEVQQARLAVKANMYMDQRWGPMRFVRGGLLVGDKLKGFKEDGSKEEDTNSEADADAGGEGEKLSSKKRKAPSVSQDSDDEDEAARKKRRKQERKAKKAALSMASTTATAEGAVAKRSKKSKKDKSEASSEDESPAEETKAERKERRRERKEKKEKKRKAKEAKKLAEQTALSTRTSNAASGASSGTSTPAGTGTSTPSVSRNFVRSRFIAQKKQAVLDTKALNQVGR